MGKKKKSKSLKKSLKPFFAENQVLLAALGGIATGITLAGILGTEKAKQIVNTLEDSVKNLASKVMNDMTSDGDAVNNAKPKRKAYNLENDNVAG